MESAEPSPHLLDWLSAALRWLALFGLALSLGFARALGLPLVLVLLGGALWSIFHTVMAALGRQLPGLRLLSLVVDLLLAHFLFWLAGGPGSTAAWAGLLPLLTAALFFHRRGALLVTGLNLLIQGGIAYAITRDWISTLALLGTLLPLYLLVGLLAGGVGRRMAAQLLQTVRQRQKSKNDSERQRQEQRSVFFKMVSDLSATLNYQRVLDTTLDMSARALALEGGEEGLVSAVLLYSREESGETCLACGSTRGFTTADQRVTLPGTAGLLGRAIDERAARLGRELNKDPELGRIVALRSCQAAYCIPLRLGLEIHGVLLFAHPNPEYFTAERREVLDILGSQAQNAIQNARLYHALEQEKERMAEIQEEARKKLARDLHDGPTQSVAALAMRVNFARRLMERDPSAAGEELVKVEDLARRTTKEIRHMLFTLRPLVLESQGLAAALQSMAEKMHETYGQEVLVTVEPEITENLELGKQGVIFYIAEEAVSNARKHAKAAHIWVRLNPAGEDLAMLDVEDDGIGFNVNAVGAGYDSRGSLGMVNMRERAELVNAVLQVDSAEGRGTRVRLLIPLSEAAADQLRRGL